MEYFPTNIIDKYIDFYSETPLTRKYEFISEDNLVDIEIKNDDFPNLKFEVNNISKLTEIEIPRIYYLGYELHNEKESKVPIFQTKDGFLGTNIKENGIYTLTYEGTIYNKISNLVRVITLIMIIIWGGFTIWNKRKLLS